MRKTKIICTLGPATDQEGVLRSLMENGMNVARLNFSHGPHSDHKKRIDAFKKLRAELGLPIGLLLDTKGPEIRIKSFKEGSIHLEPGATFTLTTKEVEGDERIVSITYPDLPSEVDRGRHILIDDGLIDLTVLETTKSDITCRVENGGTLSNNKSINIPGVSIQMPYMSKKDYDDIVFGIENGVDFIAASFVRTAEDVIEVKKVLAKHGGSDIKIIAKIENEEGVHNADEIIKVSNGLMVARGDMGVEIPLEEIPEIQKNLIKNCYKAGKNVIIATQMLDSMIRNPRPTRAETTDVANAIYDGTGAIMLSGETAIGKYPVEALMTMNRIARRTEAAIDYRKRFNNIKLDQSNITNAISHATCMTAMDLDAAAIITVSRSGHTARMVSKFRPNIRIICTTPSEKVFYQLSLAWGVNPVMSEEKDTIDCLFEHSVSLALEKGLIKNGDLVVLAGGSPVGVSGTTNVLKVHLVGDILLKGEATSSAPVVGDVYVAKNDADALRSFREGDILVMAKTNNNILAAMKKAKAIIVEEEGLGCHAAIVGMALDIPVITGATGATKILRTGAVVTLDCARGLVYAGVTKVTG